MSDTIIIAPHFDDEIIGCYEVLIKSNPIIIYMTPDIMERREEALSLPKFSTIKSQLFQKTIPSHIISKDNIFYFPDPYFEKHFFHREIGAVGEKLARNGFNVIFYSVNMEAPYCRELIEPKKKRHFLEKIYPSQKNLWKYENKYFLFEGYNKWIF